MTIPVIFHIFLIQQPHVDFPLNAPPVDNGMLPGSYILNCAPDFGHRFLPIPVLVSPHPPLSDTGKL